MIEKFVFCLKIFPLKLNILALRVIFLLITPGTTFNCFHTFVATFRTFVLGDIPENPYFPESKKFNLLFLRRRKSKLARAGNKPEFLKKKVKQGDNQKCHVQKYHI